MSELCEATSSDAQWTWRLLTSATPGCSWQRVTAHRPAAWRWHLVQMSGSRPSPSYNVLTVCAVHLGSTTRFLPIRDMPTETLTVFWIRHFVTSVCMKDMLIAFDLKHVFVYFQQKYWEMLHAADVKKKHDGFWPTFCWDISPGQKTHHELRWGLQRSSWCVFWPTW